MLCCKLAAARTAAQLLTTKGPTNQKARRISAPGPHGLPPHPPMDNGLSRKASMQSSPAAQRAWLSCMTKFYIGTHVISPADFLADPSDSTTHGRPLESRYSTSTSVDPKNAIQVNALPTGYALNSITVSDKVKHPTVAGHNSLLGQRGKPLKCAGTKPGQAPENASPRYAPPQKQ